MPPQKTLKEWYDAGYTCGVSTASTFPPANHHTPLPPTTFPPFPGNLTQSLERGHWQLGCEEGFEEELKRHHRGSLSEMEVLMVRKNPEPNWWRMAGTLCMMVLCALAVGLGARFLPVLVLVCAVVGALLVGSYCWLQKRWRGGGR